MANEADQAADAEELFLQVSLSAALNSNVDSPKAKGACLNCEEPLEGARRWCDKDCMDDWQRAENGKRRAVGRAPISTEMLITD